MNRQKTLITLSIGVILVFAGCNQEGYKAAMKAKTQRGEYNVALNLFEKLLEDEKFQSDVRQADLNYHIAESYRLSNRLMEAMPYYEKAIKGGRNEPETLWNYAYGLKLRQEYDKAKVLFTKLRKSEDRILAREASLELKNLDQVAHLSIPHPNITVEIADEFNSPKSDYAPVINGSKVYFTSSRRKEIEYTATGEGYDDIFIMDIKDMTPKGSAELLTPISSDGRHDAYASFSEDGKTMVFARSSLKKEKEPYEVNIFMSRFENGEWTEPESLPFNSQYWDGTPFFGDDGRIYFSSNRPYENPGAISPGRKSYGGLDLYVAFKNRRSSEWVVKNLGRKINTHGNEMFPNINEQNELHFSSDGHPGLGGLDVYKSTKKGNIITVSNMGAPINSSYDDFGLIMTGRADGFFASNRKDPKAQGSDDIYRFHIDPPKNVIIRYFLAGIAYAVETEENDTTILPGTRLILKDDQDTPLDTAIAQDDGEFDFDVQIEIGKQYKVYATNPSKENDYQDQQVLFSTVGKAADPRLMVEEENDITFEQDVYLPYDYFKSIVGGEPTDDPNERPEIELMILYDLDQSYIRPDAAIVLDKLVRFLQKYPNLKVELGSHTDVRGSKKYNQKLSEDRAIAAVNYLVEHGIARNRVEAKGYGEEDLKIKDATTEDEHQANRRTTLRRID